MLRKISWALAALGLVLFLSAPAAAAAIPIETPNLWSWFLEVLGRGGDRDGSMDTDGLRGVGMASDMAIGGRGQSPSKAGASGDAGGHIDPDGLAGNEAAEGDSSERGSYIDPDG